MVTMRNRQVTTRAYRVHIGRNKPDWIVGIENVMQHIDREHGDRGTQVKQPTSPGSIEHLFGLAQVSAHHIDVVVTSQQTMAPSHNARVCIYVHHATIRTEILRHLVHITRSRQA